MRLVVLSLACLCIVSTAFDVPLSSIVSTFAEELVFGNQSETKLIHHPSAPFIHNGVLYYWKGFYQRAALTPKRCVYEANSEEWPFANVTFANGSTPSGVEFGCSVNSRCNKLHCERTLPSGFVWGFLLFTSGVVAFAIYVRCWVARPDQSDSEHEFELHSVSGLPGGLERHLNTGGPRYLPL